ncbi:hypothetical protein [Mycolicibacterium wolinskyi]|uniref:hypothetical protein n=1 Tax=Mycolicibacterium wolinskyi TaxID=59750 RepID=UPI00391778B0
MTTAVVAQTKARAEQLARELGIDEPRVFGAKMSAAFEGLRAERVFIDANAKISADFLSIIVDTAAKMPNGGGIVRFVTVTRERPERRGVRVLGPFGRWLGHVGADNWHEDTEGRLVVTARGQRVGTYNRWVAVDFITPEI